MRKSNIKHCCICGKEIKGFGNNPWGALDENKKPIEWAPDDECCNECDSTYVISGRLYLYNQSLKGGKKND